MLGICCRETSPSAQFFPRDNQKLLSQISSTAIDEKENSRWTQRSPSIIRTHRHTPISIHRLGTKYVLIETLVFVSPRSCVTLTGMSSYSPVRPQHRMGSIPEPLCHRIMSKCVHPNYCHCCRFPVEMPERKISVLSYFFLHWW